MTYYDIPQPPTVEAVTYSDLMGTMSNNLLLLFMGTGIALLLFTVFTLYFDKPTETAQTIKGGFQGLGVVLGLFNVAMGILHFI